MNREWMRVALLLVAVGLISFATAPNASAACAPCTIAGDTIAIPDGCCTVGLSKPAINNRFYVCLNGCYQWTTTTQCTLDPCV